MGLDLGLDRREEASKDLQVRGDKSGRVPVPMREDRKAAREEEEDAAD
jgi:hypothetical protein